jgi:ATP-dependent Clp protease ATP-binding subunit ClpC
MLRAGGAAARVLAERGISATAVEVFAAKAGPDEGPDANSVVQTSREIAVGLGATQTDSLHLLLALLREDGAATATLRLAGADSAKLRAVVMRVLTGPAEQRERRFARTPAPSLAKANTGVPTKASSLEQPSSEPVPSPEPSSASRLAPIAPPHVPVLYREREVGRLLDLLQAKTARVIALVGDMGSGRTALLSALAAASLDPPVIPVGDIGAASSPGALLQTLHRSAPALAPIVLDSVAWLGPDGSDGVLQLLASAAGGRRWILCLTPADLRRIELEQADLRHAIEIVALPPPEPGMLLEMIETGLDALRTEAGLAFAPDVAQALVRLSPRYPCERAQPGRALAIAEVGLARAERRGQGEVTARDIAEVIADASGVPASQLLRDEDERFRSLEQRLADRVVGHAEARSKIASVLRRSYAGFRGRKPLASLLLLGPTGVGKTETARAIAEALFDGESALVRIDLSEYSEAHSIARLIGSPPGYVAHEEGGQLTEAIRRRPAAVVLFDELEKANREVLLLLLQVLEDGRLTDGRGRTVDFSSSAVVMTSNLGSEAYRRKGVPPASTVMALARNRLPPELWNRIDEILCYGPLSNLELGAVVSRIARDSSARLHGERGISFTVDDSVIAEVLRRETDRSLGARPLRRAFERFVEGPLAQEIVDGRLHRGAKLRLACNASGTMAISALI